MKFEKMKAIKQQIEIGKQKFNINPMSAIKYLVDVELIENNSPEAVAKFLKDNPEGIDKKLLGQFFGKGYD